MKRKLFFLFLGCIFCFSVKAKDISKEMSKLDVVLDNVFEFSSEEKDIFLKYGVYYSFLIEIPKICMDEGFYLQSPADPKLRLKYAEIKNKFDKLSLNEDEKAAFFASVQSSTRREFKIAKGLLIMIFLDLTENKLRMEKGTLTNISKEEALKKYDHLFSAKDVCMIMDKTISSDFIDSFIEKHISD